MIFDKIKNLFKGAKNEGPRSEPPSEVPPETKKEKQRKPKAEQTLTAKEIATLKNEPYIAITKVDLDPNNINNGSFELDWNDKFIVNLVKIGYKIKSTDSESEIVDRWFQTVCRNVALEIYEQEDADPAKRDDIRVIRSRDIGNGRSEVS